MAMQIEAFYDEATYTLSYVVFDAGTKDALVIDPVLDYDPLASQTSTASVDRLCAFIEAHRLRLHWILETHAHADHLSGSQLLKQRFDAPIGIGERIVEVQQTFKKVFDLPSVFPVDGRQFDKLIADGEHLAAGSLTIEAIHTPGHTPACLCYLIGDAVFTGDALFMHDYGTGRTDFPGGSACDLYHSVHGRLYSLPETTRVFVGHDYQPDGRPLAYQTTIARSKRENKQLRAETDESSFVRFRQQRDALLSPPRLLYQSVQINIDAGRLPLAAADGKRYLTLPLNSARPTDEAGAELRASDSALR
ncbi:MAG: MBL fold metallo-hydrolase [Deltaproteobacteria bacterium]|nr:MBL fold metallo-hydrolase [Deltaproteobacteria bacterium]